MGNDTKLEAPKVGLEALVGLRDGWDSYGSRAPTKKEIAYAKALLTLLPDAAWQLVPVSGGGVQMEMHADGMDVEILIVQPNDGLSGGPAAPAAGPSRLKP